MKRALFILMLLSLSLSVFSQTKVLFDATKHEMAGNADWVIDADAWTNNMPAYPCTGNTNESLPGRYPTPSQSGINSSTSETYWTGGISAFGVDIIKTWGQSWSVETLPPGASITYGNGTNPQDLSNYKVFIICEPQNQFTAAEKTAIISFVQNGGGLFMIADHETSDRDCDNWDAPNVFNDLTGATSATSAGIFGIWFRVNGISDKGSEDWFDDGTDNNVNTDPSDPIIFGPAGNGTGGLGFFGATSMDINPTDNPTVTAHVWRTGQTHNNLRVTFATAEYGLGRVAAIGDSSPADDGTGDSGDTLYGGWDKATGGVNNKEIHLNATYWLTNPIPDTTAPAITSGPTSSAGDCSADITWTTDESATSFVDYGLTISYGSTATTAGLASGHLVSLTGLTPSTTYHYRVYSADSKGNGPTYSSDNTFTTTANASPVIASGPTVASITGTAATISWTTNELSTSEVVYGLTSSYGDYASTAGYSKDHSVTLTGLTPLTTYHFSVRSTDACSNGPASSTDATFETLSPALDISGWTIKQYNTSLTYTFPAGTTIPQNGYLVLGRNVARDAFLAAFPSMPSETVFVNSNETGSCGTAGCMPQMNGSETFELYNASSVLVDGVTIAMSSSGGNAYQRKNPADPPGSSSSWTTVPYTSANPGTGAGTLSGRGVVINEMADVSPYANEFIELFYDGGASGPDTTPPAVIITTPTSAATYATSSATISIGGTASDNVGVTQVTWANDRGGSGTATGTTTWTVGAVTLLSGDNVITVTASDAANNTSTDVLTVTYTPSGGTPLDIGGWVLKEYNASHTYTIPAGTVIQPNGYFVLGRNVTEAQFRTKWPSMPAATSYVNALNNFPFVNGTGNYYELYDNASTLQDGRTVAMASYSGNSYQRKNPGDDPNVAGSWTIVPAASSNPGQGAGTLSAAGVVINEIADSSDYNYEFLELFYDVGSAPPPDTTSPTVAITIPTSSGTYSTSSSSVTLGGTASDDTGVVEVTWVNDSGGSGTASGTESWSIAGIMLYGGDNVITVTARDAANNAGSAVMTVTYTPSVTPPEVAAGENFTWTGQTMNWTSESTALGYRVYRGLRTSLPGLCDGTTDFCLRSDNAQNSLDVSLDDPALLDATNRCAFYLVTGYNGPNEGPAGSATCGARQVNSYGACD